MGKEDDRSYFRPIDIVKSTNQVIQKHLKDNPGQCPIHIVQSPSLADAVQEVIQLKIIIECLAWPGHKFKGVLRRYTDRAEISYSNENACWARFIIAKELAHLLCGDHQNFTTDIAKLIEMITSNAPPGLNNEYDIEKLAVFGAIDLLLPKEFTGELYKMADEDNKSDYEIALHFKVPEEVIKLRLIDNFKDFYDDLHAACSS